MVTILEMRKYLIKPVGNSLNAILIDTLFTIVKMIGGYLFEKFGHFSLYRRPINIYNINGLSNGG
jgi:hypothetical protein